MRSAAVLPAARPCRSPAPARRRATLAVLGAALLALACSGDSAPPTEPGDGGGGDDAVASVEVTPAGPSVVVGGTVPLSATAKNASGAAVTGVTFAWSSDKAGVASVDATTGVVTGVAPGTATISASGGGKTGSTTVTVSEQPLTSTGSIAYTRKNELRLVEPDGSGDRLVWAAPPVPEQPDLSYEVTGPAWRPDGGEIAFSSDHEQAFSIYGRDLYAVRPDGIGFRKLTNGPDRDRLASYPKGTVTVRVTNLTSDGPYFVYVQGAPEPQMITLGPGSSTTLTFTDVADLGDGVQPVVAIFGGNRWTGAAADVKPGQTVDAGLLSITAFGGFPDYGARDPFWRGDASKVGFVGPLCLLDEVAANPPPGFAFNPLVDPDAFQNMCIAEWGPTPALADQLLLVTGTFDDEGRTHVYRVAEGSQTLGQPVASFDDYVSVTDLRWLPDGSGFVVAKQDDLLDQDVNLYEYTFATGTLRKLTDFAFGGEFVRRFALSPDGQQIVFERTDDLLFGTSDLWIARRDGSGLRLLATGGGYPAWNPHAP